MGHPSELNKGIQTMSSSPVVVIADDPGLARAIRGQLKETLGQLTRICPWPSSSDPLRLDPAAILVLATTAPNARQVVRLVQECTLQQGPPIILVLAGEPAARSAELAGLTSYVGHQLRWPADAALLPGQVGGPWPRAVRAPTPSRSRLKRLSAAVSGVGRRRCCRWSSGWRWRQRTTSTCC
jgi:hypothetical protein